MQTNLTRYVTDFGRSTPSAHEPVTLPRYGVWEAGGTHSRPEVIAIGDDLTDLCRFYGLDPMHDVVPMRRPTPGGHD